jgi:hypothetical protein
VGDIKFDPKNRDTRFFEGDTKDWAIQDGKCFGINPGRDIGYAPNKHPGEVTSYEGHEVSREEFARMYPQIGLEL